MLLTGIEFVALALWRRRTGHGVEGLAANLAAGACLVMAARTALDGGGWPLLAWLAGAGLAHVADLRGRWR